MLGGLAIVALSALLAAPPALPRGCKVTAQGGTIRVEVGKRQAVLAVPSALVEAHGEEPPPLLVHATADPARSLAGFAPRWFVQFGGAPDGTLFAIRCMPEPRVEIALQEEGVDFGHAASLDGGRQLVFGGTGGLVAVDTATLAAKRVTTATTWTNDACWGADPESPVPGADVLPRPGPRPGEVTFVRGGACGYEADWTGETAIVLVATGSVRTPRNVPAMTVDRAGTLWLGDAGACDEPGVWDAQTRATVFRSTDAGATWTAVAIGPDLDGTDTAVAALAATPKGLAAQTAQCSNGGRGEYGGTRFVTKDGGASWAPFAGRVARRARSNPALAAALGVDKVHGTMLHKPTRTAWAWTSDGAWRKPAGAALWERVFPAPPAPTGFPGYRPKTTPDTVLDYAPHLHKALAGMPAAELSQLSALLTALRDATARATAEPGRWEDGNLVLGGKPKEYVPSEAELLAAALGERAEAVLAKFDAEAVHAALTGTPWQKAKVIAWRAIEVTHADVMGSGRFFYASEPVPRQIPLPFRD